jgi:hypothetical protein
VTHAGLHREQHQRVVAAAEPGAAIRGGEQRLDLLEGEVADAGLLVAFERDRHHPAGRGEVLGVAQGRVAVERVDRRQSCVAGPGAVASVLFEVGEERAD